VPAIKGAMYINTHSN